jgi:predicted HTH domain antitoxin
MTPLGRWKRRNAKGIFETLMAKNPMSYTVTLHIEFPREFAALLGENTQAAGIAKEFIVLGLYQEGRISGGKAAELLGLTRLGFVSLLARKGIDYFRLTPDEWEEEVAMVKQWNAKYA